MKKPVSKPLAMAPRAAQTYPFKVRSGFMLKLGTGFHRAGEIVDLNEQQAEQRRHMIEPAPDQAAS